MARKLQRVNVATVLLWGREVGAVAWNADRGLASFEFTPSFISSGFDIAPLTMPRRPGVFSFPGLAPKTFRGMPGLLADVLPDRFGNRLIDLWLQRHGRAPGDFSPVERLCYIGSRGMGALEFKPSFVRSPREATPVEVSELVELARAVVADRMDLITSLDHNQRAIESIIRVGTSAGGARAKAVISWNPATNEVRSGQVSGPPGFEPWLLKFDGIHDEALGDPEGFGRAEYAYSLMAKSAGVEMSECHLFEEGGRAHFMTRRFDRTPTNEKLHLQSLCGLAHYDFNLPGAYGYESILQSVQQLNLGYPALVQAYRRMIFNIMARNQDDHTRNVSFLMDQGGMWRLAPAYDIIWAYNPAGEWTDRHQLSVNGKRDGFSREDLLVPAREYGIKSAEHLIEEVGDAVGRWPTFAATAELPREFMKTIGDSHRRSLAKA